MKERLGRRAAIEGLIGIGALSIGAPLLAACSSELTCSDISDLSADDIKTRTTNAYVDKSADPAKLCSGCKLYKPAGEKQCGGCQLVKGPINPKGNCKSWSAKT